MARVNYSLESVGEFTTHLPWRERTLGGRRRAGRADFRVRQTAGWKARTTGLSDRLLAPAVTLVQVSAREDTKGTKIQDEYVICPLLRVLGVFVVELSAAQINEMPHKNHRTGADAERED